MKKIIAVSFFVLFIGLVPHTFAADATAVNTGFTALAPIPGLTDNASASLVNSAGLANFFNNLYKYLIGIAAILAVIEIIYSGIRIATNQDNVSVLTDSKGKIWQAILGLVLVLSPVVVFSIINPSILNLSLNLPALDTATTTSVGTGGSGSSSVPITPASNSLICKGTIYSQIKTVPIPAGNYCNSVLGSGWTSPDPSCAAQSQVDSACAGTNPPLSCTLCGLPSTNQDAQSVCNTIGTAGILQIATCPSVDAAQIWSKGCTGKPTAITALTKTAAGAATVVVSCEGTQKYVFIDTRSTFDKRSFIAGLMPLAKTTDRLNNGNDALQFANTCKGANLGWRTCISDRPIFTRETPCLPTPTTVMQASVSGKCYKESLICTADTSIIYGDICSNSPSWTPFQ